MSVGFLAAGVLSFGNALLASSEIKINEVSKQTPKYLAYFILKSMI
jgi:hypothetical protein